VGHLVVVELERCGQGVEDLPGWMAIAAALESEIVVGTDAGEHREFFASKAGDASETGRGDASLLGRYVFTTGSQVASERVGSFFLKALRVGGRGSQRGPRQAPVRGGVWLGGERLHTVSNVVPWKRISRRWL